MLFEKCYKIKPILFLLVVFLFFLSSICFGDVIILERGEKLEGKIINADSEKILFKAKIEKDAIVCSFDKQQITKIKLSPYEFPTQFTIFDKFNFKVGDYWFGLVELETPEAIYFSLAMDTGVGIVELPRRLFIGIDGTYGYRKMLAKIFFFWRNLICDLKFFISKAIYKKDMTLDMKIFNQIANKIKQEKWDKEIANIAKEARDKGLSEEEIKQKIMAAKIEYKVYRPKVFKKEFKRYLASEKNELYELGVKNKCVMLEMNSDYVKRISGSPSEKIRKYGKEYWEYNNGDVVIFRNGKVVSYSKGILNLKNILKQYYTHDRIDR